jgi:hypothetical protein
MTRSVAQTPRRVKGVRESTDHTDTEGAAKPKHGKKKGPTKNTKPGRYCGAPRRFKAK